MAQQANEQLLIDIKSFRNDEEYSDFIITCGVDTYNVHKIVVCKRSEFFAKAVKFGKEAVEGKVDLPEDDPAVIKLLIDYLYEAEYEPRFQDIDISPASQVGHTCANGSPILCDHHSCGFDCEYNCKDFVCDICYPPKIGAPPDQLLTHAKMYEIADKYRVSGLKDLSMRKFQCACITHWDHLMFPEAAAYALSTTQDEDRGLRDIICKTISKNMCLLKKPEFEALMMQFNGLAYGLLKEKGECYGWFEEDGDHTCENDEFDPC